MVILGECWYGSNGSQHASEKTGESSNGVISAQAAGNLWVSTIRSVNMAYVGNNGVQEDLFFIAG